MEATARVTRAQEIPVITPLTNRPRSMSVDTRIEIVSNVIACVLHNAFATQNGLPSPPLAHLQPAVQRTYEGMARLSVVPLLDEDAVKAAEWQAIEHALAVLSDWEAQDEDAPIPSFARRDRMVKAMRLAISTYNLKVMGIGR